MGPGLDATGLSEIRDFGGRQALVDRRCATGRLGRRRKLIDAGTKARPVRRSRAPRGEGDKLKDEIISVAEQLLLEAGSEQAVSMRAIADRVGCTPPALYMHFADKDELFHEVCGRRFTEFDDWIEEAGRQSDDPLESLRLRGRAYIRFGLAHPEVYRLLMLTKSEGDLDEPGHEAGRACFQHLVDVVTSCIQSGAIADSDPVAASVSLWSAVHGLTSLLITFPDFSWGDVDALIDLTLDVAIEGLLAV